MAAKTQIDIFLEDTVPANQQEITLTPIVPAGKVVTLFEFGASSLENDWAALQWGSGSSWTTVRACYREMNFVLNRSFVGDGSKRFRFVRNNSSALTTRIIFAWVTAVVQDAE